MTAFNTALVDFLEKWGIQKKGLAEKIGLSKSTFNNKLKAHYRDKLTFNQVSLIKRALQELKADLEHVVSLYPEHEEKLIFKDEPHTAYKTKSED